MHVRCIGDRLFGQLQLRFRPGYWDWVWGWVWSRLRARRLGHHWLRLGQVLFQLILITALSPQPYFQA
ncbi:hypothetical protein AU14_05665 [Marinobacter similis]|uniref:Uncharacterized protein n=1 Tax=Marinobacter similis TaxID=1420916 RepID=W5YLW2_9GAMM|nr:hypothetical protein AU14_05665 [Marinobacter similis]